MPPGRESPWREYPIEPGRTESVDLGPLRIWWKVVDGDFWLARQHLDAGGEGSPPEPEGPAKHEDWVRLAAEEDFKTVRLSPCFPDRAVMVQPEMPLRVAPGGQMSVHVSCPLFVEVALPGKKDLTVAEIPSLILSNTWFGSVTEGELCYWISSRARRRIEPREADPYLAICPIGIHNNSPDDLLVERICLRVMNLTLYLDGNQLWSDVLKANYRGGPEISELRATGKAPSQAKGAKRIRSPREPRKDPWAARTFRTLRTELGLGEE